VPIMAATTNPFPGMNPFLERNWAPVHSKLLNLIDDEVARQLPPDLVSRPEERILIDEVPCPGSYRADVAVTEREDWKKGSAPVWKTEPATTGVAIAEPEMVWIGETVERWIEIRTVDGFLVTAIELLRPSNKTGDGVERYKAKQRTYLQSKANLVEIDLLRDGRLVLPVPLHGRDAGTCYYICISRAWRPQLREVYHCPLRERLPAFRLPLRETDADVVLDLQPLIDRCYETGRYYLNPHDVDPSPPFSGEEAVWVKERLQAACLR
jgi:hypothetical protein